jgi:hypothetical protein
VAVMASYPSGPLTLTSVLPDRRQRVSCDKRHACVSKLNGNCRCHVLKDSLLLVTLLVLIVAVTAMVMVLVA